MDPPFQPKRNRLRVLLVDDSRDFLESISRFLSTDVRIEIVGRATSGGEALEQVKRLDPDLILMDLVMDDMDGLDATRLIKTQGDPPFVIIVTIHDDGAYREAARAIQADGFVSKSEIGERLLPLISRIFSSPSSMDSRTWFEHN